MSTAEQVAIDFFRYPPIGEEDWRYAFATAKVRCLESMMLSRGALLDIANAPDFNSALDMLSGSEYAFATPPESFAEIENMLLAKRTEVRELFLDLMLDDSLEELLQARHDFANMRLAIRRVVTERPIGTGYSNEGSVDADEFQEIFEQESYTRFPMYLQEAVESAVLGYYEDKDICRIDYEIDKYEAQYRIAKAKELDSVFLLSLFRTRIDLANIRTMLRLKLAERQDRNLFLPGGYVETGRFVHGLDIGYEAVAPLFFATPYYELVEGGVLYLTAEKSFLRLERLCEEYIHGFLVSTASIAAGPQPVIAYLLLKECEIRTVRMLLTAKKNGMDVKLILDRLGE